MKNMELTRLRRMVNDEIERRKKVNNCLDKDDVLEYLKLVKMSSKKLDVDDIRDILVNLLKEFKVTETNEIYVCTCAYDEDNAAPIKYYLNPNTDNVDHKEYKNIESGKEITSNWCYGTSSNEFERTHTVLNPYNTSMNKNGIIENGYDEVRLDFFEESYKHGQYEAIQKILKKYPRIGAKNYK